MNIPGIPPSIVPIPVARPAAPPAERPAASASGAPSQAPTLWDVLTAEEREFFAQQQTLGPLTYRRGTTPPAHAPAPTGRRIDVRG